MRANLRRKWSTTISKPADNHSKAGWSWGWVSAVDSHGQLATCQARPYMKIRRRLTRQIRTASVKKPPHQTDLNQAEDASPAGFFASCGPCNCKQSTKRGKKEETT